MLHEEIPSLFVEKFCHLCLSEYSHRFFPYERKALYFIKMAAVGKRSEKLGDYKYSRAELEQ